MTIGVSIFLVAAGAVLKFAVSDQIDGVDLAMVGVILMIAGAVGLLAGLVVEGTRRRDRVVVDEVPVERRRR